MTETIAEPATEPDKPVRRDVLTRWTPEQAKAMSRKAADTRRKLNWERLERLAQYRNLPDASPNQLPAVLAARALVIEDLIRIAESTFKQASTPYVQSKTAKDMQGLAMAIAKLYEVWSLLTGHERPGVRLPQDQNKEKQAMVIPMPQAIQTQGLPGLVEQASPDITPEQG